MNKKSVKSQCFNSTLLIRLKKDNDFGIGLAQKVVVTKATKSHKMSESFQGKMKFS